jgi:hypothetical protein
MAQVAKRLIEGSVLTGSAVTYYTPPTDTKTIIKKLPLINTTGGAVNVTIYLISSGGSAAAANTLTYSKSVAAGETWSCTEAENMVLESGGILQALGNGVTIMASGIEIS